MVSVLFAGIPFMVYLMASEELSPAFHDFYTDRLVIGAAIVIALVFVELLLMGIQAHRAHLTEVDRVVAAPRIPRRDACVCETRIYRYGLGFAIIWQTPIHNDIWPYVHRCKCYRLR